MWLSDKQKAQLSTRSSTQMGTRLYSTTFNSEDDKRRALLNRRLGNQLTAEETALPLLNEASIAHNTSEVWIERVGVHAGLPHGLKGGTGYNPSVGMPDKD